MYFQEDGMKAFVRLESGLMRRARRDPYYYGGRERLDAFMEALTCHEAKIKSPADFIFVSIDFEGDFLQTAGKGFGVAILDTRDLLGDAGNRTYGQAVETRHFAFSGSRRTDHDVKHFIFGDTVPVPESQLSGTIVDILNVRDDLGCGGHSLSRKIVLVGHGLPGDLDIMEQLGVSIEEVSSIVGIVDTGLLGKEILGCASRLMHFMNTLSIPWRCKSFHCGGDDANYTFKVLLSLPGIRQRRLGPVCLHQDGLGRLKEVIMEPLPLVAMEEKNVEGFWCDGLDGFDNMWARMV